MATNLRFRYAPSGLPFFISDYGRMLMYTDSQTVELLLALIFVFFVKFWWIIFPILAIFYETFRDRTTKPTFSSPNEITALIMVALAKNEGYLTADKSQMLIKKFKRVFFLDDKESSILLTSSNCLLKDNSRVLRNIRKFLEPNIASFTEEQELLALSLFTEIATLDGSSSAFQNEVIDTFKSCFHNFRLRNSA
ncbi:MAG: hypothetical protein NTW85_16215 [Methylococcales bacterium]|nr:hypothetical protein [Methylococcales bacterium]